MAREIAEGITVDPQVMVGKPVIKGTRVPVELVLAKLAANPDVDELLADYPHLTVAHIQDCLRYAARLVPLHDQQPDQDSPRVPFSSQAR